MTSSIKCLDADPSKRPTATELCEKLTQWDADIRFNSDTEFYKQVREAEKINRSSVVNSFSYKTNVHTSRLFDVSQNNLSSIDYSGYSGNYYIIKKNFLLYWY